MRKIILFGIIAAFFFSSTFPINRWLNVHENGHWFWTCSLRYFYVSIFLFAIILLCHGRKSLTETIQCYLSYWYFWIFAGGIGFGLFYLLLCYAASYSSGWVLATSWQITILMTPMVIMLLGNKMSSKGLIYLIIIFIGIVFVNVDEFSEISMINLKSIVPISVAAFCYPLGNTLCKYACEGRYFKIPINKYGISKNIFSQILLMTLGALPILFIVGIFLSPPHPTNSQLYSTAFIALSTGVIATSFLYKARQLSNNSTFALSAADGTQSAEAPMALFWEWLTFGVIIPSTIGVIGLALVFVGILFFYRSKIRLTSWE
ncbi:MAG TPA: multidrug resistance efflux transporter family protein [Saprospiraceae bacterium]|nr:multidrug resistance efflux transporter family protein [Saprospiraceae bacterium]